MDPNQSAKYPLHEASREGKSEFLLGILVFSQPDHV